MGRLVAGGELDPAAEAAILGAARAIGLPEREAEKTFASGFSKGQQSPRQAPEFDCRSLSVPREDCRLLSNPGETGGDCRPTVEELSSDCRFTVVSERPNPRRYRGNLSADVTNFIVRQQDSWTRRDLWHEFDLTDAADKHNLRTLIDTLLKKKLIYKDTYSRDTFWTVQKDPGYEDLDAGLAPVLDLALPLGLSEFVRIPRRALLLLEGCTNSGKIALVFNALRDNFSVPLPARLPLPRGPLYEVVNRIKAFEADLRRCLRDLGSPGEGQRDRQEHIVEGQKHLLTDEF